MEETHPVQETIAKIEGAIVKEEKQIIQAEQSLFKRLQNRQTLQLIGEVILVAVLIGGGVYWYITSGRVFTDQAQIEAPLIDLGPEQPGVLKEIYVHEGDLIDVNTTVARVNDELVKSTSAGIVVGVTNEIGGLVTPGSPVVTMINPSDLRVNASIPEDKGLSDIRVGQRAVFTVDAFGSKQFTGVVDSIAKTAKTSSVVFSISDKRQEQEYVIKIKFDQQQYPELLNGMSARVWIYK